MLASRALRLIALAAFLSAALALSGCQSRAASAEKLFQKGEYEQVMSRYPDLEVALRARAKMAEKLLQDKQYDAVLQQYSDTPAAYQAKLALADQALNEGKYKLVLDSFPNTPAAQMAKAKLADSLYKAGLYDELIAHYGDTPQAAQVKDSLSAVALKNARKLRGDAKKLALEDITRKYPGTAAYKDATSMLAEIRKAEAAKKK